MIAPITSTPRVIVGQLRRERHLRVAFTNTPASPPAPTTRRPAQIAHTLALAHHLQRAIDSGAFGDRADVARRLRLSRARVTQLLDLLLLAPDIQDALLHMEAIDGAEPMTERILRPLAALVSWTEQRTRWEPLAGGRPRRRNTDRGEA